MTNLRIHYLLADFLTGILLICLPIYFKVIFGFSGLEVGGIYFIGGIIAVVSSIANSFIAQKIKNKKRVLNFGLLSLVIGTLLLTILSFHPKDALFYMVLICFIFITLMRSVIYILADEISMTYIKENPSLGYDYGKIRSFGSIGWGANFLINGLILVFVPSLFMITYLLITIIIWINSFYLPVNNYEEEKKFEVGDLKEIFKLNNFLLYLLMYMLICSVINNINVFIEYTILDKSGKLIIYFIISLIFIIVDMGTIHFSAKILNKLGTRKYISVFLIFILLKVLFLIIVPYPPLIYFSVCFDSVIFGLLIPFNSTFIKNVVPGHLSTIAYMMTASLSLIAVSISAPVFGYLYDDYSVRVVFGFMLILIIVSYFVSLKIKLDKKN